MRLDIRFFATAAVCLLAVASSASLSVASPGQGQFLPASFSGIGLLPYLQSSNLVYTLSLGINPEITIGANTYGVNWVQAFYVMGEDQQTSFNAVNGATVTDWRWQEHANPSHTVGWVGTGNARIYANDSKTFGFADLAVSTGTLLPGFHLGYQDGSKEITGYWKGTIAGAQILGSHTRAVPEPGSILAILSGVVGLAGRKRVRQRP